MIANLKAHWFDHLLHVGVGAFALSLCVSGGYGVEGVPELGAHIAGAVIAMAQYIRQSVGFWQKRDTVSLDMAYCMGGQIAGAVVGLTL